MGAEAVLNCSISSFASRQSPKAQPVVGGLEVALVGVVQRSRHHGVTNTFREPSSRQGSRGTLKLALTAIVTPASVPSTANRTPPSPSFAALRGRHARQARDTNASGRRWAKTEDCNWFCKTDFMAVFDQLSNQILALPSD
jgi:hypothetical protein